MLSCEIESKNINSQFSKNENTECRWLTDTDNCQHAETVVSSNPVSRWVLMYLVVRWHLMVFHNIILARRALPTRIIPFAVQWNDVMINWYNNKNIGKTVKRALYRRYFITHLPYIATTDQKVYIIMCRYLLPPKYIYV